MRKILVLLFVICYLSFAATPLYAITLREFLEDPLPDIGAFMAKVWGWLQWLWDKIIGIANIILDWALDNILAYVWKVLLWVWNLIKTTFIEAWNAFLYFWNLIKDNDFIDWGNIAWPWD
jgi:hypothetical protein